MMRNRYAYYSDYYPGGMLMPNRNGGEYRYGYQGSEVDNDVKGKGNSYTTYYRSLDVRLNRWLSLDPKASKFPWQSPYVSMDNNPVFHNDPLGDDVGYRKFGDKVRVGLARVFNKKARELYRKRRDDVNVLHLYSHNSEKPLLKDAESHKFIGAPYGSTNIVQYSTPAFHLPDWEIEWPDWEIKFYKHEFQYDVEKIVTRGETKKSDGRETQSSKRVGQLQNILINTKERPDLITVNDKTGSYIGGTEDGTGANVPMVTRNNRFAMDARSNRSWITIPTSGSAKGKVNVISRTPRVYLDNLSGTDQTNYSAWQVKLQGRRSFGIFLPWPQKAPVKFNDKGF